MATARHRNPVAQDSKGTQDVDLTNPSSESPKLSNHPLGAPRHGTFKQTIRIVAFGIYFLTSCLFIHGAQLLGLPLYFYDKAWFYAWMAMTKSYFGILATTMTQWWSPTTVRISGDASMKGLLMKTRDRGALRLDFGERVVLMANHQIYTDWLYLWWIAYANDPAMHGHIYIILKESLKWIPLIGPGMQFFGFIFMARKWAKDQARLRYRLQKLNTSHNGPVSSSPHDLDPMWLLIFPEGTNLSRNGRRSSANFATKSNIEDMKHQLLPRSTGLYFCLRELRNTVPYLYDCTITYEGVPEGQYGQDIFTLRSVYFQGRPPKSVNMHWRRFATKDLPLENQDKMHEWLMQRWREKDELLDVYAKTGRFPGREGAATVEGSDEMMTHIDTQVMANHPLEVLQGFVPVLAAATVGRVVVQLCDRLFGR